MSQFFPADVSLRVVGDDLDGAQRLFPAAKQLLFKALRVQEAGNKTNVSMFIPGTDGSIINVFLAGGLKHVYVQPGKKKVVSSDQPTETQEEFQPELVYVSKMLSGIVQTPIGITINVGARVVNADIDGDTVPVLRRFNPDAITSFVYELDEGWQDSPQLGVNQDGSNDAGLAISAYPKPSMFSGSMKRFVQAILGIGKTQTETEQYLTGDLPPTEPDLNVYHNFDWHWNRTHGIVRVSNGNWIVEISKLNGVVAMPAPMFYGTEDRDYLRWLYSIGDVDTASVVEEFGGLPTGEPFPTGTDLADALTNGKVIRLMTAADLLPFYYDSDNDVDKFALFEGCGWAFSESGIAAINTSFWYKDFLQAHPQVTRDEFDGIDPYPYTSLDPDDLFCRADYYRIDISLSAINSGSITAENPAGTGSAVLTRVESSLTTSGGYDYRHYEFHWDNEDQTPHIDFYDRGNFIRVPQNANDSDVVRVMLWGAGNEPLKRGMDGFDWAAMHGAVAHSDAVTYAFFVGETAELLRQNDPIPGGSGTGAGFYNFSILHGTSVDSRLLNPDGSYPGVCTTIPAFCREGYIFHWAPSGSSGPPGYATGFFDDLGIVEFTPNPNLCSFDGVDDDVRGYVWNPLMPFGCGIVVNCGLRPAMIGHDGPNPLNLTTSTIRQYIDTSGLLVDLSIPEVDPEHLTFVGAP